MDYLGFIFFVRPCDVIKNNYFILSKCLWVRLYNRQIKKRQSIWVYDPLCRVKCYFLIGLQTKCGWKNTNVLSWNRIYIQLSPNSYILVSDGSLVYDNTTRLVVNPQPLLYIYTYIDFYVSYHMNNIVNLRIRARHKHVNDVIVIIFLIY